MSNYLVTGGAGFIGSHLVEALLAADNEVCVLDNLATGRISNLTPFLGRVKFVEGDVNDTGLLQSVLPGVDFVLHQAALPSVPRSLRDPLASHEANSTGTLRLLIAARDAQVKKVVFASSSSVYGDSPTLPKREDMPTRPLSPYAVNKLAAEEYCKVFTRVYGLPTVALRYFNVFGPRQDPASEYAAVIPAFVSAMLAGQSPVIHGDGTQTRDFTFVSNVVSANLLACETGEGDGQAFNIACGQQISLLDLVSIINALLGTSIQPIHVEPRQGDVKDSLADISAASHHLGYKPLVSFKDGLKKTLESLQGPWKPESGKG